MKGPKKDHEGVERRAHMHKKTASIGLKSDEIKEKVDDEGPMQV